MGSDSSAIPIPSPLQEKRLIQYDIEKMETQIAGLSLYKIVDKIGEGERWTGSD